MSFSPFINLSSLDSSAACRLDVVAGSGFRGRSVAPAGDVNGVGFNDLIISACATNLNATERL